MPPLHLACMRGDLLTVLDCITSGGAAQVHRTIAMRNQSNQTVSGITPLFLAAQRGHLKVCKLLVENGAKPNQPSYISGSTDLCTPAQVAKLNFHLSVSSYLKKAVRRRKEEDAVLALDDDTSDTGGAGHSDAESEAEEGNRGRGRPPASVAGSSRTMGSRRSASRSRYGSRYAAPSPAPAPASAAQVFMDSVTMDLSSWDPSVAPPVSMEGVKVQQKLLKKGVKPTVMLPPRGGDAQGNRTGNEGVGGSQQLTKWLADLDLESWRPDDEDEAGQGMKSIKSTEWGGLSFLSKLGQSLARSTTANKEDPESPFGAKEEEEGSGFESSLRQRHGRTSEPAGAPTGSGPSSARPSLGAALSGFFSRKSSKLAVGGASSRHSIEEDNEVSQSMRVENPNDLY